MKRALDRIFASLLLATVVALFIPNPVFSSRVPGRVRGLFVNGADKVIANTNAETTIFGTGNGSLVIPAGELRVGRTIVIRAFSQWNDKAGTTPNLTWRVKLGTTTVVGGTAVVTATSTGARQSIFDATITVITTGASGTVFAQGEEYKVNGSSSTFMFNELQSTGTVTIDTTVNQTLDVTIQWGSADIANSYTVISAFATFGDM